MLFCRLNFIIGYSIGYPWAIGGVSVLTSGKGPFNFPILHTGLVH